MPASDPLAKPWWTSRTLWLNVLSLVVVVATAIADTQLVAEHPTLVLSLFAAINVANAILRWLTTQPLACWLLVALLTLPGSLFAQTALPAPGRAVGYVEADTTGKWIVLSSTLAPVSPRVLEGGKVCVFEAAAGQYAVIQIPPGDAQPVVVTLTLGGVAPVPVPPPGPSPPGPEPPTPPGPGPAPPNPQPAGPRNLLIFHESANKTQDWTRTVNLLRVGPQSQYLAAKGHRLWILDDDSVGSDGRPSPAVAQWQPQISGLALPVLLITDPATRVVIHKQSLPATVTADGVLEILKAHGG